MPSSFLQSRKKPESFILTLKVEPPSHRGLQTGTPKSVLQVVNTGQQINVSPLLQQLVKGGQIIGPHGTTGEQTPSTQAVSGRQHTGPPNVTQQVPLGQQS